MQWTLRSLSAIGIVFIMMPGLVGCATQSPPDSVLMTPTTEELACAKQAFPGEIEHRHTQLVKIFPTGTKCTILKKVVCSAEKAHPGVGTHYMTLVTDGGDNHFITFDNDIYQMACKGMCSEFKRQKTYSHSTLYEYYPTTRTSVRSKP